MSWGGTSFAIMATSLVWRRVFMPKQTLTLRMLTAITTHPLDFRPPLCHPIEEGNLYETSWPREMGWNSPWSVVVAISGGNHHLLRVSSVPPSPCRCIDHRRSGPVAAVLILLPFRSVADSHHCGCLNYCCRRYAPPIGGCVQIPSKVSSGCVAV
ncbi:unnamed protein product [Lactuca virosa]|uniref:Secreted protein n=1 Tax=Lactuca virosa TaxID=75947 RepID=A0AAU9NEQ1_9ASTR|nr:unnamed protein product [Lactuca virosa]